MFNNVGIVIGGRTHTMSGEHRDRAIDVNLMGVVNGVVAAYPLMAMAGHGHIVNTAHRRLGAGGDGGGLLSEQARSRRSQRSLARRSRDGRRARQRGVRPGSVDTPILDSGPPADLPPPTAPR